MIEVVGLTTYQLVCMGCRLFYQITLWSFLTNFLPFSLCCKREAMGHVWRNVGRHELWLAEPYRCKSMARRVVLIHRLLDCSF
jgi:hypothetical protein